MQHHHWRRFFRDCWDIQAAFAAELQQQKLPPMFLLWELRPGYEAAKCSQNQPFFNALAAYMYVKPTQNYNILYIMF